MMKRTSLLMIVGLLCVACASPPPPQPRALRDAQQNLQRGTAAYANDEYHLAANAFTEALDIYQSIDDSPGILEASVNLIETGITVGNSAVARQRLEQLKQRFAAELEPSDALRLTLLEVRLLHAESKPETALALLRPLWPAFDQQQRPVDAGPYRLAIIAATARLMRQTNHAEARLWLQRLANALQSDDNASPRYRALLLRLQADQLAGDGESMAARESKLREALAIYRPLVFRRGIGATLQQLAELEVQRDALAAADGLYQRALKIQLWTLDREAAIEVLRALVEVNRSLGDGEDVERFTGQLESLLQVAR